MANSQYRWKTPEQWDEWSQWLAAGLHARNRWRLPVLLMGMLFANGRRTVTTWLRAAGISDDFHDVKGVWGTGQQQVRNIWTNLAVYNLNLWMHTLVELWSWNRNHKELCNRRDSPWDDAASAISRGPTQSLTSLDHAKRIIDIEDGLVATSKNHRPDQPTHGAGRLKHRDYKPPLPIPEKTAEGRFLRKCRK